MSKPIEVSRRIQQCIYLTIAEYQIPPLPDQEHLAFWEKEWIAPELKELLFAQPESEKEEQKSEILRTYLIVDAHLYTKARGFFDLDLIDEIPMKCLFNGQAAEEMKAVAPYLLDMTLPEAKSIHNTQVPKFHKDYFEHQWEQGTGMVIRSTVGMDELHHHLRKFTKVQDEQGKWYFFRFWEPRAFYKIMHSFDGKDLYHLHNLSYCIVMVVRGNTLHLSFDKKAKRQLLGKA